MSLQIYTICPYCHQLLNPVPLLSTKINAIKVVYHITILSYKLQPVTGCASIKPPLNNRVQYTLIRDLIMFSQIMALTVIMNIMYSKPLFGQRRLRRFILTGFIWVNNAVMANIPLQNQLALTLLTHIYVQQELYGINYCIYWNILLHKIQLGDNLRCPFKHYSVLYTDKYMNQFDCVGSPNKITN